MLAFGLRHRKLCVVYGHLTTPHGYRLSLVCSLALTFSAGLFLLVFEDILSASLLDGPKPPNRLAWEHWIWISVNHPKALSRSC